MASATTRPEWGSPPEWGVALRTGEYLRALRLLRTSVDDAQPISYDMLAYVLQAIGRYADAAAVRARRAELERTLGIDALPVAVRAIAEAAVQAEPWPDPPEITTSEVTPALLRQVVRKYRLLILGEEHHFPEHRAFGARILPMLQQAGITHLALETSEQASLDVARQSGRVTPGTDSFSYEPQRAALLRAALAVRLPLIAFDMNLDDVLRMQGNPDDAFTYRERRMAEHIVEDILQPHPDARVLVWVGYGHSQKGRAMKMMAQHLWELADEEPFSMYQLTGEGRRTGIDVLIRHPRPSYARDRPDWLRQDGRRSVIGSVESPGAYLVQLHLASEGPAGTPVDQLLTGPDGVFELLVPSGDYLLRLWSPDERVVETRALAVQADIPDLRLRGDV